MIKRPHHEDVRAIKRAIVGMTSRRPLTNAEIYQKLVRRNLIEPGQQQRLKVLLIRLCQAGLMRSRKIPGRFRSRGITTLTVEYEVAIP